MLLKLNLNMPLNMPLNIALEIAMNNSLNLTLNVPLILSLNMSLNMQLNMPSCISLNMPFHMSIYIPLNIITNLSLNTPFHMSLDISNKVQYFTFPFGNSKSEYTKIFPDILHNVMGTNIVRNLLCTSFKPQCKRFKIMCKSALFLYLFLRYLTNRRQHFT